MTTGTAGEAPTGFRIAPLGPFILRDYSGDDPATLTGLRSLLEAIITDHRFLIPGSLNRLIIQWHADVHRAILAGTPATGRDGQPGTGDGHHADPSGRPCPARTADASTRSLPTLNGKDLLAGETGFEGEPAPAARHFMT
jgi:hypothetical protein